MGVPKVRISRWALGSHVLGVYLNLGAVWVGGHWSSYNRRLCVNLVPCLTVWLVLPGGNEP